MEAGRLYLEGEKGAYKYALKMLRNREIPDEDFAPVLSMLFNINLLDPRYARYIVSYLEQSKSAMGVQRLAEIINRELDRSLQDVVLRAQGGCGSCFCGRPFSMMTVRTAGSFSIFALMILKRHRQLSASLRNGCCVFQGI